jgi:diguanylate cyclase (GGDEF)-like protein
VRASATVVGVVTTRLRAELAIVIAIALGFQAVVPWLPLPAGRAVSDAFIFVMVGRAAIVYGRRFRHERGRVRGAVAIGAISSGFWSIANLTYLAHEIHNLPVAFTAAGVLSVAAAQLLPLGMHLNSPPVRGAERYRTFLDIAAVSGAVFALTWMYVLEPARNVNSDLMTSGFAAALTGPEVLAAALALVTMSRHMPSGAGLSPRLLGSAALVLALTALMALRNGVEENPWYSGGSGAGYLLAAGLVMVASRAGASRAAPTSAERHFSGGWALLPYVPIILAVVATAAEQIQHTALSPELVWVLLATFSLVLIRQFMTVAIVGRLAVTLESQQSALAHQAHHDSLTGLHNRAAFNDLGDTMLAGQGHASVLLIDLDGFKPVNDNLGHAAGDQVLAIVAERLRLAVRPGDLVCRLGGDEFALLLDEPATEEAGLEVGGRILESLAQPMQIQGTTVVVGGSIGLASGHDSLSELLRQADVAMYAAKAAGKGKVRTYPPASTPVTTGW